jgi:hypothetical protein
VDGEWGEPYFSALQEWCLQLDNSFDLGDLFPTHVNPVVYSRKRHLAGLEPHTFRVTSASPRPQCRWLRSRSTTP